MGDGTSRGPGGEPPIHRAQRLRRLILWAVGGLVVLVVTLLLVLTDPGSLADENVEPPERRQPKSAEGCEAACDDCERECLRNPEACPPCSALFEECCEAAQGLPLEDCECLTEEQ